MFKKIAANLICCLALCALLSANAFGCACCAEPGAYYTHTSKPDDYYLNVVNEFKYSKAANIFMTEAGYDTMAGLEAFQKEDEANGYMMPPEIGLTSASLEKKIFRFEFRSPKGLVGSLAMPLPLRMSEFKVDIHDNEDKGLGPLLYKEFRFNGSVSSAAGFLRSSGLRGTKYFLVFQGRGRGCNEVSDFTHWRLDITGPKADYAFYGKLDSGQAISSPEKAKNILFPHLDTFARK
jgi:hypothetical protein